MTRRFDTPESYQGPIITRIKQAREAADPRKRDLSPTRLDFGPLRVLLARHFGFCYGVENAVEIAYRTLAQNAGRRVFFLSEMIHNPKVNGDLLERGVRFLFTPAGEQLVPLAPYVKVEPGRVVVDPPEGLLEPEPSSREEEPSGKGPHKGR